MNDWLARTTVLIGQSGVDTLADCSVAVFGAGGVGGYAIEALARCGIGRFLIVDGDTVANTNINRQLIALTSTVGQAKADLEKVRILDINPNAQVDAKVSFYLPENADQFDFSSYDYIVDAIDTVAGKLEIIRRATEAGVPVISAMGAGNKRNPMAFQVSDIMQTQGCPLARVIRRELRKMGVTGVKVVYSQEEPAVPIASEYAETKGTAGRIAPGSMPYVPATAGLLLAYAVIEDLLARKR